VTGFTFKRAANGWEQIVATNHLGTAHLAFRMLPYLLKAEKPRLVVVASEVHYWTSDPEEADSEGLLQKLNEEGRKGKFAVQLAWQPLSRFEAHERTVRSRLCIASPTRHGADGQRRQPRDVRFLAPPRSQLPYRGPDSDPRAHDRGRQPNARACRGRKRA